MIFQELGGCNQRQPAVCERVCVGHAFYPGHDHGPQITPYRAPAPQTQGRGQCQPARDLRQREGSVHQSIPELS